MERGVRRVAHGSARAGELAGSSYIHPRALRRSSLRDRRPGGAARREVDCASREPCFAAFLGLGALFDHERYALRDAAARLPVLPAPEGLGAIVPDLPALTPLERRVVCASAAPLSRALPAIAAEGARLRLLPIDVRPTDLPELALAGAGRTEDHRAFDAIGGLAAPTLAVSRIDELLDVVSDGGLVFAHELAHLAFFHLEEPLRAEVEALHREATELGWVAEAYALENPHELFAVTYTDWLRERFDLPRRREPDDAGIFAGLAAVFEALAGTGDR